MRNQYAAWGTKCPKRRESHADHWQRFQERQARQQARQQKLSHKSNVKKG
jgi:hypothetical protein